MTEAPFLSVNPATGKILAQYSPHNDEKIAKALAIASGAFKKWRTTTFRERSKIMNDIARQLRLQKEELAVLATTEMGKPIQQSRDEIEKCARTFEYYAKEGPRYLADEIVKTDARKSYVTYQPLGVVLAVMPWNFPYWQVFRAMAPTLMAGNTMLLKHASNIPGCALAIENIMKKAGAPKGLFQTLLLSSHKVADLIAQPAIAAVTFTGSTAAGRKVAEAAGRHLKKQVLELGGSDAYVVLKDADLQQASEICFNARLINSGQSCVSAKRFVVVKEIRKEFEKELLTKMKQATFGDPFDTGNKIGPLARVDLRDELHRQVLSSIEKGAKLLCGGYIPAGEGAYYPPTVLSNVKKGMPAYDEELFGPVAAIIEAKNEQLAIKIANDSEYGLGAAVFSKDRKHAEKIAASMIDAGNCFVNASVHSDARLPFGGVKNSGYGRELGIFGIREFVNIKNRVCTISPNNYFYSKHYFFMLSYLALGDSYTIGELVPFAQNFPNETVRLLRRQGIDVADPVIIATTGWTTDELQAAIREHNINETFSFVSLLIGVNNQYRGRDIENYKQEFTQLLEQAIFFANGHPRHVFVLSIPDWGVTPFAEGKDRGKIAMGIDAYNAAKEQITMSHKCHYIEITESTRANGLKEDFLAEDKLHPSAKEYAIWASLLAKKVEKVFK